MPGHSQNDDEDRPRSRWGADFWSKYRKLSSLIASRPDGYPPKQLIPGPRATPQIQNTEKLLSHVTGLVESKRDATGDKWTAGVAPLEVDTNEGTQTVALSLANIAAWTPKQTTLTRQKPGRAAGTETVSVRGYLPPTAATHLFRQFQDVLDHLGWAENVVVQDYQADESEVASYR